MYVSPSACGQHSIPTEKLAAMHRACIPQSANAVGDALGAIVGEAEGANVGASVLSQQVMYVDPSLIGQQRSPAVKLAATHRSCIPQSANCVGDALGDIVGLVLGKSVGLVDGDTDGEIVGDVVGLREGDNDGDIEGADVGASVLSQHVM